MQQESFSPGQWSPYSLFDHDIGPMTSTVHGELMAENIKKEQPQYINYNTALYVQPSQWWRVGQAKLIRRFASVLASPIPVPPSPLPLCLSRVAGGLLVKALDYGSKDPGFQSH